MFRIVTLSVLLFSAPAFAYTQAEIDAIVRDIRSQPPAPSKVKESDRAACHAQAVAAGGPFQRQNAVMLSCLDAARLRAQGR